MGIVEPFFKGGYQPAIRITARILSEKKSFKEAVAIIHRS
jgi:hypothetical protein